MKRNKGITLIALVVTIVVLLILAGISISMLGGENGIITKAQEAKEENRGGTVEERRDLWKANQKSDESTNSNTAQTLDELLEDLENEGLLTSEEVTIIKDVGVITIGSHVIDFTDGEIDWSKMAPGLYETGTRNMIKSWDELIEDGDLIIENNTILKDIVLTGITGDLIISNDITTLSYYGNSCETHNEVTGLFFPGNIENSGGFIGFKKLKKVVFLYGIKHIDNAAFKYCTDLTDIEIPNSVTKIGNDAFYGCTKLNNITIPSNLTSIGDYVFYECTGLTDIIIPSSITSIGNYAFYECTGLTNITIPSNLTNIGNYAFYECTGLTNITIPSSVTSIGNGTFSRCTGLTDIIIPSSVTSIGNSAFSRCTGLTDIIIPSSVTNIGSYAFSGCIGLTDITIPSSVTNIESNVFSNCGFLASISVDSSNLVYDSRESCNAIIETNTNKLIQGCKNTKIPNTVTNIGSSAFSGCTELNNIEIPNTVTNIENSAFYGCTGLTNVEIPSSIKKINNYTFSGCQNLKVILIPASVVEIASDVFANCINLNIVNYTGTQTQWSEIKKWRGNSYNYLNDATINYNYSK